VTSARFSFDGKLLVTTGTDSAIIVWNTTKWEPTGKTLILPGEIHSAVIGPNDQFVAATSQLSEGIRFFDISTGRAFGDGIDTSAEATTIDLHPSGDALAVACADGTVRGYDSPWVEEDTPKWMPDFAERIIGLRVDGPEKFAPVFSSYEELKQYPPAGAEARADFSLLAKWMVTYGIERTLSPRTLAPIESNIVQRVAERSLESLYELFEADPGDPLIFAAMSLFVPGQRQGEYLAEYALPRASNNPLARAYVASTFAKYGRLEEAEGIMKDALAAAPNDARVLRRAAKLDTLQKRKQAAIEKLDRAVAADPNDEVTYRDYGWQMYDLGEPATALEKFKKADEFYGGRDTDINAGIALAAAALGDQATAIKRYKRMIRIGEEWGEADYIKNLKGWTAKELLEMERLRKVAITTP
jgi:tetratricopeptide (TPR) repeat protein